MSRRVGPRCARGEAARSVRFRRRRRSFARVVGRFFNSGQRTRFHRRMAASSRSSARLAGRCGVQPRERSRRQACTVEYLTPHSCSISSATRQAVHRLVPYPKASGPRFRPLTMRRRSVAESCGGRPARGARFNAGRPPSVNCLAHRFTDWRCAPTRRATSASGMPCARSRAARRRRCSRLIRSSFTPAGCPMRESINELVVIVTILCNCH